MDNSSSTAPTGTKAVGYGNNHSFSSLGPIEFERRPLGADDVGIRILYCGVCHSDVHQVANDWSNTVYPCIPGHEIVGEVTGVGSDVTTFAIGEIVAVGCMVDSCGTCESCRDDLEQYCEGPVGPTLTYNGPVKPDGSNTYGGYSDAIVVKQHFVLKVPANLDVKAVAPILCAGVTTYSPLKHWKVGAGQRVGVIGLGGLGHMAVKLASALGAEVTVFSTSEEKQGDALRFGATLFVLSTDADAMEALELRYDLLIDTIPAAHDPNPFVKLLKRDGTLAVVGLLMPFSEKTNNQEVAFHRRSIAGSLIGGIAETQEVLDFCGQHQIAPEVELIAIQDINDAHNRIKAGEVHYRYVIDVANTLTPERS